MPASASVRRAAVLLLGVAAVLSGWLVACTTFGSSESSGPGGPDAMNAADASAGDTGSEDVRVPGLGEGGGPICDVAATFGPPKLVPGLNTDDDEIAVHLSLDERRAYVSRVITATGDKRVYMATLSGGVFGQSVELDLGSDARDPTLTDDELTIYFAAYVTKWRIHKATRLNPKATGFTLPVALSLGSVAGADDYEAHLGGPGSLAFGSERLDGGDNSLWSVDLSVGGAPPALLLGPAAEAAGDDDHPVMSRDGLVLYFGSDRGSGGANIHLARRASIGVPFDAVFPVAELDSAGNERPMWLSPDLCRLYFASDRPGGPMLSNIWVAERKPDTR